MSHYETVRWPRGAFAAAVWIVAVGLTATVTSAAEPAPVAPSPVEEAEPALWHVYTVRSPEMRATVEECRKRLDALRKRAAAQDGAVAWRTDADVLWLLEHRIPAALVVDRAVSGKLKSPDFVVLAGLIERLGHAGAARKLPLLLNRAGSDADRLVVLRAMADLRTPEALEASERFLNDAGPRTADELIGEAARGLGLTRDARYLAVFQRVVPLVASRSERIRIAAARLRCGDPTALRELLAPLREPEPDPALCAYVLRILPDFPELEVIEELARIAVEADDAVLAEAGLAALRDATGATVPPPPTVRESEPEETPAGTAETTGETAEPTAQDQAIAAWGEADRTTRQAVVEALIEGWRQRGRVSRPSVVLPGEADA